MRPQSGRLLPRLEGHRGGDQKLAVDPQGRWLAAVGDTTITLSIATAGGLPDVCQRSIESLPEGNWVVWSEPKGAERQ